MFLLILHPVYSGESKLLFFKILTYSYKKFAHAAVWHIFGRLSSSFQQDTALFTRSGSFGTSSNFWAKVKLLRYTGLMISDWILRPILGVSFFFVRELVQQDGLRHRQYSRSFFRTCLVFRRSPQVHIVRRSPK
jgi:hypothetical protein